MELGGGGRRGAGDRVRRQLQSVGRLAAYLGGGFVVLSAASSVAIRSLRALSDANQKKKCTRDIKALADDGEEWGQVVEWMDTRRTERGAGRRDERRRGHEARRDGNVPTPPVPASAQKACA